MNELLRCVCVQTCAESITAVQGGNVGSAGFAEVFCSTYAGQHPDHQCFCSQKYGMNILSPVLEARVADKCVL